MMDTSSLHMIKVTFTECPADAYRRSQDLRATLRASMFIPGLSVEQRLGASLSSVTHHRSGGTVPT